MQWNVLLLLFFGKTFCFYQLTNRVWFMHVNLLQFIKGIIIIEQAVHVKLFWGIYSALYSIIKCTFSIIYERRLLTPTEKNVSSLCECPKVGQA